MKKLMEVKKMGIKGFLAYTNPITIVMGIPVLCGIILAVITNNVAKNTVKVVTEINKDIMD